MKIETMQDLLNEGEIYKNTKIDFEKDWTQEHDDFFNKRFVAVDNDLDLYRELINKYGKANIWGKNVDEICEMIEKMFKAENTKEVKNERI